MQYDMCRQLQLYNPDRNCWQMMYTSAHLFFLGAFAQAFLACFTQLLLVLILTYGHTVNLQLLLHIIAHNFKTWRGFPEEPEGWQRHFCMVRNKPSGRCASLATILQLARVNISRLGPFVLSHPFAFCLIMYLTGADKLHICDMYIQGCLLSNSVAWEKKCDLCLYHLHSFAIHVTQYMQLHWKGK